MRGAERRKAEHAVKLGLRQVVYHMWYRHVVYHMWLSSTPSVHYLFAGDGRAPRGPPASGQVLGTQLRLIDSPPRVGQPRTGRRRPPRARPLTLPSARGRGWNHTLPGTGCLGASCACFGLACVYPASPCAARPWGSDPRLPADANYYCSVRT